MGDVVNLRQARKAKARAEEDNKAANNRLQFGRRKHDKELLQQIKDLREKNLNGHKRDE
jgi:hypothetical protein